MFHGCFLNWEKYLYAIASGAILFEKRKAAISELKGFVSFDRSQFKENIFAFKGQQNFFNSLQESSKNMYSCNLDLFFDTRSPVVITTPYLETYAAIDLHMGSSTVRPELQGTLQLRGGKLIFPIQALTIFQGKLSFLPGQIEDPFIELIAQGRVKRYLVTVTVGGSARDPHIFFTSTPALSEEQIIMLLLTGSEHESLNVMFPALIMRNIEAIILGNVGRLAPPDGLFDSWLKPLEHITFVPRFTDQTGRGGLKAALEIEVSSRLHATIEKNFSLSEDTAFEMEYAFSDDVGLKITKGERGDMGAEVAMRFKF